MKLKPVPSARRVARDLPGSDEAAIDSQDASDVRGVIDNATSDRLYGWAWDAKHPGARLKVELRLAGDVVANTIADFVRPDLARTGVGDGCHAFEFPLVPAWIERKADLTAVAFGVDGTEFPIAMRIRRAEETAPAGAATAQIVRALETLQGEQEGLHAELRALHERVESLPEKATMAAARHAQDELERKVEQLEIWLTRLDARLGEVTPQSAPEIGRRLDIWQAALVAAMASVISAALAVVLGRQFLPW